MATRNIVPRGDGEGSVGTSAKKWDAVWANKINNTNTADLIANTQDNYRQPDTTYTLGTIKYHHSLPTDYYLECTTQGTTSSGDLSISSTTIGDTVTDGTVTWTICKEIGTGNVPLVAGYNQKQTFTSSGSFTAPTTGLYKITLQGAGGGGSGSSRSSSYYGPRGGGGGGAGGHLEFYEKLTAGTSYSFTIGAGGAGSAGSISTDVAQASNGGNSSIAIGANTYLCTGGGGGFGTATICAGGRGGIGKINDITITQSAPGAAGGTDSSTGSNKALVGGGGGGAVGGGGYGSYVDGGNGYYGGGGGGGGSNITSVVQKGGNGGDGYITFEWLDTSLL